MYDDVWNMRGIADDDEDEDDDVNDDDYDAYQCMMMYGI
jgi:hypothetical protein